MQKLKKIDLISGEKRYLIDYANIKQGLISNQINFLNEKKFRNYFFDISKGFPLVLPFGLECFDYSDVKKVFKIRRKDLFNHIYKLDNFDYKPAATFLNFGNLFCFGAKPKKKYHQLIRFINSHNTKLKEYIKQLKKKNKIVAALQTRNVPHLGHEEIIKNLLNKCDHVIINPVIGPKKSGDVNYIFLEKIYNYLINKKYKNRVSYFPVIANMFYAGPREAMHHAIIRQNLGFDIFNIGRDHAGAESAYNPNLSIRTALKFKKKFKINLIVIKGAYYCKFCQKAVIKGSCKHAFSSLEDISGTDFRKKISEKKYFKFANKDLQIYLHKLRKKIFV